MIEGNIAFPNIVPPIDAINTSDLNDYLSTFHHHEKHDPKKIYTTGSFMSNYNDGMKKYEYQHHSINGEKYVSVIEIVNNEELIVLARYCRCRYCKISFCNPFKWLMHPQWKGCLKFTIDNKPCPYILKKTREYLKLKRL